MTVGWSLGGWREWHHVLAKSRQRQTSTESSWSLSGLSTQACCLFVVLYCNLLISPNSWASYFLLHNRTLYVVLCTQVRQASEDLIGLEQFQVVSGLGTKKFLYCCMAVVMRVTINGSHLQAFSSLPAKLQQKFWNWGSELHFGTGWHKKPLHVDTYPSIAARVNKFQDCATPCSHH